MRFTRTVCASRDVWMSEHTAITVVCSSDCHWPLLREGSVPSASGSRVFTYAALTQGSVPSASGNRVFTNTALTQVCVPSASGSRVFTYTALT
jgi:hypothetical protein